LNEPRRILLLDHEGGWGGASRSLFFLVTNLDAKRFEPVIWYRQEGPLAARLQRAAISSKRVPDLFNLTPRAASHPANLVLSATRLPALRRVARQIASTSFDVLHCNYEGLAPIALALQRLGDRRPRVLHVRVMNPVNPLTRVYARFISKLFDHVVFISENERDRFVAAGFAADAHNHSVLYNPIAAELLDISPEPPEDIFRVTFFGTLDRARGVDRLIEVAERLRDAGTHVQFDLFGKGPRYRKMLLFKRSDMDQLRRRIARAGVSQMLRLKGHTATPELEMTRSHLVIRPSRGADPWGRDVIESMSLGVPVLASGRYQGYIHDGCSGLLVDPWDAARVAGLIGQLAAQPERALAMGQQARNRARQLFAPDRYAHAMQAIYDSVIEQHPT
jgi:glycosyltransferase involved in cell wall biosynthesis